MLCQHYETITIIIMTMTTQEQDDDSSNSLRQILEDQYVVVERFANAQTMLFNAVAVTTSTSTSSSSTTGSTSASVPGMWNVKKSKDGDINHAVEKLDKARRGVRKNWIQLLHHPAFQAQTKSMKDEDRNKNHHRHYNHRQDRHRHHHLVRHLTLSRRVVQTINMNPQWHPNGLPAGNLSAENIQTTTVALASLKASIAQVLHIEQE
mmetsp:Transcript_46262/g.112958  ORF Transcript_46262/g.112958 Transcript_46262/m.112958 type:complete len:207 (+) Transcript_46262:94-714(+)